MKKTLIILTAICFALYSCTDLDVNPDSKLTDSQAYNEKQEFEYGLSGLYGHLQVWVESIYKASCPSTDEMLSPNRSGDWKGDMQLLYKHTWDANTNELKGLYEQYSVLIATANDLIGKVDKSDFKSDQDVLNVKNEARFLRSFAYFMMMDMFANVPLKTDPDYDHKNPPKQATRAQLFTFVESELKDLSSSLPKAEDAVYGRACRNTAKSLLVKLYLNAEVYLGTGNAKWSEVVTLTKEIMDDHQYVLEDNFKDVFKWDNYTSKEMIFPLVCDSRSTKTENITFLFSIGDLRAKYGPFAAGWGGSSVPPTFFRTYDEEDVRRDAFIFGPQFGSDGKPIMATDDNKVERQLDYTIDFTTSDPIDGADHWDGARGGKYLMDGIGGDMVNRGINNDIPIIRYADILLMRAEALFRISNTSTEALQLVNQVRTRNGNNPIPAFTVLTEENLLAERGREFAWEGWRRNDLIRFDKFNDVRDFITQKTDPKYKIFPIPTVHLKANPNMQQNPGY
ncbi:RagB/SusD family nutrient uptake outer membrane protein [Prevotella sp. 10(H)]|uniref:RagB/SusD family nutrient uptake outer membrane protein n=1 Tax=Prevotella sp. 10(H) TaxID=1158294 RepID=UPI0004A70C92|nr:RagB/SusD family nutrient uptake outer membrane protein [Prevotella sp. 10(H)]